MYNLAFVKERVFCVWSRGEAAENR